MATVTLNKNGQPRKARAKAPEFDLNAVVAEETTEVPKIARNSKVVGTKFPEWVQESYDRKVGKVVTVPTANAIQVANLIRAAARQIGLGASIKPVDLGNGQTRITFVGKEPKKYSPRKAKTA